MSDWADDSWNDFAAENDLGKYADPELISLLKEAWLDGARTALAKAQRTIDSPLLTHDERAAEMAEEAEERRRIVDPRR